MIDQFIDAITQTMTKRDNEKETERPHYYSQFWLDVAAGRRVIGTPKPNEESELTEAEPLEPSSSLNNDYTSSTQQQDVPLHIANNGAAERDTLAEERTEAANPSDEEYEAPEADLDLIFAEMEETDDQDALIEETDIPDMDLSSLDEDEEDFDEEESGENDDLASEDGEEDEMDWGRGRKKAKSLRQVKTPARKPIKRDSRRGSY